MATVLSSSTASIRAKPAGGALRMSNGSIEEVRIDQEEDLEPGLHFRVDHAHEVDAGDLRGRRLLADQGLAVALGHHSVTSTFRKRRSPRARSR